jgi:hypothetical protein
MVKDEHLDKDLFRLLLENNIHIRYAAQHLPKSQIDEVDEESYIKAL